MLILNVFISAVQQNTSVIYICVCIYMHTHTCTIYLFSYSFPLGLITRYWIYCPVLHSRNLLFVHYIHNSLHLGTPNSQICPSPSQPQICSLCVWVFFCFIDKFIGVIIYIPHISDTIGYLSFSFWLTSMTISRSIHLLQMELFCCQWI